MLQWNNDNTLCIEPPKRPKKMSGTRFASVLGMNRWSTPFQMWCEITKTYSLPFEDSIYTIAGKTIEPLQIQYMRDLYMLDNLIDPTDVWGEDPFKKTYGNFFAHKIFGGMWDALLVDKDAWDGSVKGLNDHTEAVLEFKTTKRAEDWEEDVPEYYALQAALYAYLLNCDQVIMVVSFLEEGDYEHPENFEPSVENTAIREFFISERYPNFEEDYIKPAVKWWDEHVVLGISPEFNEKLDEEYLRGLRTTTLNPTTDINALLTELTELNAIVDAVEASIAAQKKRQKEITEQLKQYATEQIKDEKYIEFGNDDIKCRLTVSESVKPNKAALMEDGVYNKYMVTTSSSRFTVSANKKGE